MKYKDWEYVKLGEICEVKSGGTPKRSEPLFWNNGKIPWVKIGDMSGRKFIESTAENITELGLKSSSAKLFHRNTIIFSIFASIGEVAILNLDATCNQAICGIFIKDEKQLENLFLFHFLKGLKSNLIRISRGVAQNNINLNILKQILIPLPPLSQQQEIVRLLDKAGEMIELRKKQLDTLDTLSESVFYQMFGDPVTNEKDWELKRLGELTSKIGSGATPKGGNSSYKIEGISLIRSLNVHDGEFRYKDLAHIDETQANLLNNVIVQNKDVLLNITGASVARSCIVPSDVLPARVNQHVAILRVIPDMIDCNYLNALLISDKYQQSLLQLARSNGATREALTKADIQNLSIPLPPLSLQQKFADIIEKIEQEKALAKEGLQQSEDLFQRLMQDLFPSPSSKAYTTEKGKTKSEQIKV